jgi:hypothetical protein
MMSPRHVRSFLAGDYGFASSFGTERQGGLPENMTAYHLQWITEQLAVGPAPLSYDDLA